MAHFTSKHNLALLALYPAVFIALQIMPRVIVKSSAAYLAVSSTLAVYDVVPVLSGQSFLALITNHRTLVVVIPAHNVMVLDVQNHFVAS